jgi:hypothetical protein
MSEKKDPEEIIEGAIYDTLNDWKSEYKISEDLPAIADILTEYIIVCLEDFNYEIIKKDRKTPVSRTDRWNLLKIAEKYGQESKEYKKLYEELIPKEKEASQNCDNCGYSPRNAGIKPCVECGHIFEGRDDKWKSKEVKT